MKKFIILLLVLAAVAGAVYYFVFFENNQIQESLNSGTILLGEQYESLDPFSPVAIDQQFLHPVYENLIDFDQNFKIQPALAFSFGRLSDTSWQFKLRSDVFFHDESEFNAENVTSTFAYLIDAKFDHYQSLIRNLDEVVAVDDKTIIFDLKNDDPDFLRKLTRIPILPHLRLNELTSNPIGTGSYKTTKVERNQISYQEVDSHWRGKPVLETFSYQSILDPDKRFETATASDDVLAVVPFPIDFEDKLKFTDFALTTQPDLTTSFFIWNPKDSYWDSAANRIKLQQVFPYEKIEQLTSEQGTPANQFVSNGVFGFNPDLIPQKDNFETRKNRVEELGLSGKLIRFAVPATVKNFGLNLETELNELGLVAEAYVVEPEQIFDPFYTEGVHLLFLGWRSDSGTINNFLSSFLSAGSQFNVAKYNNQKVNDLISELRLLTEESERLKVLQQIMLIISDEDPYGLPLFYGRLPYVTKTSINLPIRADGTILVEAVN